MKPFIVKGSSLKENDYGHTKVTDVFNSPDFSDFSVAKVRKVGDDIKLGFDKESDSAYYVLEGKGACIIEDKKFEVEKGDLIFLPRGTKYKNLNGLTLLAISFPRFERSKRVYLE